MDGTDAGYDGVATLSNFKTVTLDYGASDAASYNLFLTPQGGGLSR